MLVERSTFLPCPPKQCFEEVRTSRLLQYVARPLVKFVPVDPPVLPKQWEEKKYLVRLRILGVIPFGCQTINISVPSRSDAHFELRDNGYSSLIPKWDHLITIRAAEGGCVYSDRVEIRAGVLTPFVWSFAWLFYRHRQRRWVRLVNNGFEYKSPGKSKEPTA